MQLFHLFSFVVAASYAAALPQPAELSGKYSNNVDATLASGLEARSYQPRLNSHRESATLMSLKRRGNSGSGLSPPPDTTPEHTVSVPFTDDDVTSENLASMISKVKNGGYIFLSNEEAAGKRIGGYFGDLLTMYLGRATYIISAVQRWIEKSVPSILDVIESGLSEDEYSKVLPGLKKQFGEADDQFRIESIDIAEAITNISENVYPITFNLLYLSRSFQASFASCWAYIGGLRIQLKRFESGKTLYGYLTDIHNTLKDFLETDHDPNYKEISREFETAPSRE
ncbi:hypothetical protein BASA60_000702 [Batrachochytrium salamandrivorans]|nr:hypothetical protein BASA60_000702 [Batrachochytrium salamandrivorans]